MTTVHRPHVPEGDDGGITAGDPAVPAMRAAPAPASPAATGTGTASPAAAGTVAGRAEPRGSGVLTEAHGLTGPAPPQDPARPAAAAGGAAGRPPAPAPRPPEEPAEGPAAGPGRLRRLWRKALLPVLRHPVASPVLLSAVLHAVWFFLLASGGGDLAAQDAWAEFVDRHPDSAYNLAWYGGLHPFSYSVLSPYLMAALGVRSTLILAGVLSSLMLALLLRRVLRRPLLPALWGSFSFACDAASGRVTFALGVLFALGAIAVVWAWPRRWWRAEGKGRWVRGALAAVLAALATTGSPVAGLFLEVVAAALFLDKRRQAAYALAVPPPVVVGVAAVFFPFEGMQPMPWWSVFFPLACAVPAFFLVPRTWRTVRLGSALYAAGVLLAWIIPSQVGSNVERLSLLFGLVTLLAAAPVVVRGRWRSRRGYAVIATMVVAAGFQIGKPTYDVLVTTPDAAWAGELAPLVHQLKGVDAERGRVEIVPVRSHREASALAPYVNLARGWNRQADTDRNPLFYESGRLDPETYHEWLRRWAVRYVVLPADDPDEAGAEEARIVRAGQPYLREVWGDANWRLYRVADPVPMAAPPAHVIRAGANELTLRVDRPGAAMVRIPWSPWLSLVDGRGRHIEPPRRAAANLDGCLRKAEPMIGGPPAPGTNDPLLDTWTVLDAPHPGTYHLAAPYRLPRGTPCPADDQQGVSTGPGAPAGSGDGSGEGSGEGSGDGDGSAGDSADSTGDPVPPPLAPPRHPPLP